MTLDIAALIAQGFAIAPATAGYDVTTPDGRHGFGATVEDAVLNVGAQIVPDESGRRQLIRENGDVIALDAAGIEAEPTPEPAPVAEPVIVAEPVTEPVTEPVAPEAV